jgi:hypothetical protein
MTFYPPEEFEAAVKEWEECQWACRRLAHFHHHNDQQALRQVVEWWEKINFKNAEAWCRENAHKFAFMEPKP